MTAELSADLVLPSPAALEVSDDPGQQIVLACERATAWLRAGLDVSIESIIDTKAQAAAIAEFAIQKQLGKDAELAALEVQRRAERGTGLAIRRGQEAGTVMKRGDAGAMPRPGVHAGGGLPGAARNTELVRPTDYVPASELSSNGTGIYAMTDHVTNEQFDAALEDAKAEGNLSRANVVRKIKGETGPIGPKPGERHELLRKTRHIDPVRVVRETVYTLEGLAQGVGLINVDDLDLDQVVAENWATSLTDSLRVLNRLSKQIKEMTHVYSQD